MYLVESHDKDSMENDPIFKGTVNFCNVKIPPEADRCEIWGTSFDDGGSDYCEYRFFKGDIRINTQQVAGY